MEFPESPPIKLGDSAAGAAKHAPFAGAFGFINCGSDETLPDSTTGPRIWPAEAKSELRGTRGCADGMGGTAAMACEPLSPLERTVEVSGHWRRGRRAEASQQVGGQALEDL